MKSIAVLHRKAMLLTLCPYNLCEGLLFQPNNHPDEFERAEAELARLLYGPPNLPKVICL